MVKLTEYKQRETVKITILKTIKMCQKKCY